MSPQRKISTRLIRKGPLIEETYLAFQHWDLDLSFADNLSLIKETNTIGVSNSNWLQEIVWTLASRFEKGPSIEPLVVLAQGGLGIELWSPCLLWHIGMIEELYYRFATEWLFSEHESGTYTLRRESVIPFVRSIASDQMAYGKGLTERGISDVASDLLRTACAFGLLTEGRTARHFKAFHLPEASFLYVLHAIAEQVFNARQIIDSMDWRLYLMSPEDVERELFNLHQYHKVHYQAAGSLAQLKLPCNSLIEYARKLVE